MTKTWSCNKLLRKVRGIRNGKKENALKETKENEKQRSSQTNEMCVARKMFNRMFLPATMNPNQLKVQMRARTISPVHKLQMRQFEVVTMKSDNHIRKHCKPSIHAQARRQQQPRSQLQALQTNLKAHVDEEGRQARKSANQRQHQNKESLQFKKKGDNDIHPFFEIKHQNFKLCHFDFVVTCVSVRNHTSARASDMPTLTIEYSDKNVARE